MKLTRLNGSIPLTDGQGRPTAAFLTPYHKALKQIEATLDRIRRTLSHTVPTTIFHAADAGTNVTLTIDAHTRVFADATSLAVSGGTLTGLAYSTTYAVYYDDTTLANASPTYHATTDLKSAQTVAAEGRFFMGIITTPAHGGAAIDGGGVYAMGSNVGGELA